MTRRSRCENARLLEAARPTQQTNQKPNIPVQQRPRHELARAIVLEDGEPWRLAEAAATRAGVQSAGGVAPAEVDRLRATATGAAKLARALAQGEVCTCVDSFSMTQGGDRLTDK